MSKQVFISFSHKNLDLRNDLRVMFAEWGGPIQATPVYLTEDVREEGTPAVEREIQKKMQPCCGLLLAVGEDVHNSEWIDYELNLAAGWQKPWAPVRHPRSKGGLPNNFRNRPVLPWDAAAIARVVAGW